MKENLIYTAGLIDGEGTITLSKGEKFRYPVVSVTSTSYELLQFLQETYGGTISTQKTYKSHHKQAWSWKISYDRALDFITEVRPYMKEISKCKRCDMLLQSYKYLTNRNGKYTCEQIQAKLNFETAFLSS